MKFKGKVAIVSGGARDIGRAVSVKLAAEGAKVVIGFLGDKTQAEETLNKEFSNSISSKFKYIYFAKDFIVNNNGEVEPGIGGEIYKRLGLGESEIKNSYVPKLVKERREVFK